MRPAWRAADRAAELLAAARGWRAAGLIDQAAFDAVAAEHPAAGPQLGQIWRVLVFLCVAAGVSTATVTGFFTFGVKSAGGVGVTLLIFGGALAVVTDVVVDRCAFRPTGAEAATSLLAVGYLCGAVFVLLDNRFSADSEALRLSYAWCAAVFTLAAWRWGVRLYAGGGALFFLLLAVQFPGARLILIALAALLAAGATAILSRRELTPSHRDGVELARLVALAAIYGAVNYYSVDSGFLEKIDHGFGASHHRAGAFSLLVAGLGSALVPGAVVAWGLRARDRALIGAGLVFAALSLSTIRFYVHVAPLWVVLAASGTALAATSLLLERWLRAGAGGERGGFTAEPLYDDARKEQVLPIVAALAQAPAARALPADDPPGVPGGGGTFGGGGTGGSF